MANSSKELVAGLGTLPPIPHVASQVLRLTSDPNCSASELQRVIASDQALTVQVLKTANSAAFGMVREVRTLSQAIMALGLNTVKSVVIASSAKDLYMRGAANPYKLIIWEHSLVTAIAGRTLAKTFRYPSYDDVFLSGLMHDIGKLVLDVKYPDRYWKIIKNAHDGKIPDILQAEVDAFGFDHTMVGEALSESWNIPSTFSQCVRWHHDPRGAAEENVVLTAYVALGNVFAQENGKGIGNPQDFIDVKKDALELVGVSENALASHKEAILECLELDKALISGF